MPTMDETMDFFGFSPVKKVAEPKNEEEAEILEAEAEEEPEEMEAKPEEDYFKEPNLMGQLKGILF